MPISCWKSANLLHLVIHLVNDQKVGRFGKVSPVSFMCLVTFQKV